MRDHFQVFDNLYRVERWGRGTGSGTGSSPHYCEMYLDYLERTIPRGARVYDVGCGDLQMYTDFDLTRWRYIGIEVSPRAIELAEKNKPGVRILKGDARDFRLIENGYVLLKDVLMHWTDKEIDEYLEDLCSTFKGTILASNNWRYFRKPSMNGHPRNLDRYSWAPIPLDFPLWEKWGFELDGFYPRGKYKAIMKRDPL